MRTAEIRPDQDILSPESDTKPGDIYFHCDRSSMLSLYPNPHKKTSYSCIGVNAGSKIEIEAIHSEDPNWVKIKPQHENSRPNDNQWVYLPNLQPNWIRCTRSNKELGVERAKKLLYDKEIHCRKEDSQTKVRNLILEALDNVI